MSNHLNLFLFFPLIYFLISKNVEDHLNPDTYVNVYNSIRYPKSKKNIKILKSYLSINFLFFFFVLILLLLLLFLGDDVRLKRVTDSKHTLRKKNSLLFVLQTPTTQANQPPKSYRWCNRFGWVTSSFWIWNVGVSYHDTPFNNWLFKNLNEMPWHIL